MNDPTLSNLYENRRSKIVATLKLIGVGFGIALLLAVLTFIAFVVLKLPRFWAAISSASALTIAGGIAGAIIRFTPSIRARLKNAFNTLWQNANRSVVVYTSIIAIILCLALVFPLLHHYFDPYTSRGWLTLEDSLQSANQNPYKWDSDTPECQLTSKGYKVAINKPDWFEDCISEVKEYQNFVFEAQMSINATGDCGGLFFRDHPNQSTAYFFRVCSDGHYQIYRYSSGPGFGTFNPPCTKQQTDCSIIEGYYKHPSRSYVLAIEAQNNTFTAWINHEELQSQDDAANLAKGHIGFVANEISNPTTVTFKNAKLWEL